MWLALLATAFAGVRFERTAEKVETEEIEEIPLENQAAERRKWIADAAERAALASLDGAVRWRADGMDACARDAGVAVDSVAKVDVIVGVDGAVKAKARGGADTLAGCVVGALDGQVFPLILADDVRGKYTVTYTAGAPEAAAGAGDAAASAPGGGASASGGGASASESVAGVATPEAKVTSPRVDEERGFAGLAWGDSAEGLAGASSTGAQKGTTFYARISDSIGRWFGAKLAGAAYAFGEDGLHSVVLTVEGTTTAWRLREALTARYGAPGWDNRFGAYFWRGERVLLQLRPTPGSEEVRVTLLDIERARASGLADRMPGDPVDPTKTEDGRRMLKIYQQK